MVVEILSPSTALCDRNTKYQLYQQQGVKHYLLVDIDEKKIESFELKEGLYQPRHVDGTAQFTLEEGCVIAPDFSAIFEG